MKHTTKLTHISIMALACFYTSSQICSAEIVNCPAPENFQFTKQQDGWYELKAEAETTGGTKILFKSREPFKWDTTKEPTNFFSAYKSASPEELVCVYKVPSHKRTIDLLSSDETAYAQCNTIEGKDGRGTAFDCKNSDVK